MSQLRVAGKLKCQTLETEQTVPVLRRSGRWEAEHTLLYVFVSLVYMCDPGNAERGSRTEGQLCSVRMPCCSCSSTLRKSSISCAQLLSMTLGKDVSIFIPVP